MGKIVEFRKEGNWVNREVICLACGYRYIATELAAVWLKNYQCPNCKMVGGIIATGQPLDSTD
jgi:hypothetical protein